MVVMVVVMGVMIKFKECNIVIVSGGGNAGV